MAESKTRLLHLVTTLASAFFFSHYPVEGIPYPALPPSSRAPPHPPPLPQYYPTSSQRPTSPQSSLAPTSPVYTASRIRPNSYSSGPDYEDPYPSSANLGTAITSSGGQSEEDDRQNSGFVEPIDFSSLLKDIGSSPKGVGLDIGASNTNPLFASESKDTFQGFFGSTKNPFEELNRLNTASSEHQSRRQNSDGENLGFVDPNVQFRSLFDSAGPSSSSGGFSPQDFLGSKSENIGSAPSKASQTRAYPSYTYSGRGEGGEREDSDRDEYYGRGNNNNGPSGGPNRYRSSYRQVGGGGDPDYYGGNSPEESDSNPPFGNDRVSNSPSDSYDDGPSGPSYYAPSPGGPNRSGGVDREYERPTPRYSPQASNSAPQTKSKAETSASSKNPRCKKVEKTVDYGEDHASFTDPEPDYDPATYQSRYKRQARQRGGRGGNSGGGGGRGGSPKRPMTCYVCEDEHGRYAEKCSYDSNGSPSDGNNYFHSESSSYSDNGNGNGNNNNGRRNYGGKGKDRPRRTPSNGNRQRSTSPTPRDDDKLSSASTIKSVSLPPPEIAESEPKVVEKRQSGSGFDTDNPDFDFGSNPNRNNDGDPYDASSGSYRHPTGYEGPPLSAIGGAGTNRAGGGGFNAPGSGGGFHGGGGGFHGGRGGGGYHGGRGGRGGGGDESFGAPQDYFGSVPDYEREAAQATREYDFTIPREFDPDYQLGPSPSSGGRGRGSGGGEDDGGRGHGGGGAGRHEGRGGYGGRGQGSPRADQPDGFRPINPHRRSGPHQSASTNSNRRSALEDFDIGYNDYVRSHFPEASNSPSPFGPSSESTTSYNPSGYDFRPNYYHRSPGGNREQGPSHETSNSSPSEDYQPHHGSGHRGHGGRGGYVPHRESTQPSHNFAPPPGFFSEDAPAYENYENLGNIMKDFSTRSRDGCQKVNKGDMTCYVCKDAKGMKKEECIYASNDPRNKAMAYHEVAEYSSPTASVLPAPRHLTSSEESPSIEASDQEEGESRESEISIVATPASKESTNHQDQKAKGSSIVTTKTKKSTNPSDKNKNKLSNRTSKSTTIQRSSTVIVHERSKRSLQKRRGLPVDNYDFDY